MMNPGKSITVIVKFLILFLILCNLPSYFRVFWGSTLGSLASYSTSLLLIVFYIFTKKKHRLLFPFILLGLLFHTLSGINYDTGLSMDFIKEFIRFMIVVICSVEVLQRTNNKEVFYILLIGALSIIINAVIFPTLNADFKPNYGRFSGFYLNPNFAGSICLVGYALSYSVTNKWVKIFGQFAFTLAGIFTFSRSFIVIWLIVSFVSIYNSKKNLLAPMIGASVLILIFAFSSTLSFNKDRFSALESIFSSETQVQTQTITEDSRTHTWGLYTDLLIDKPFFGHGYGKMRARVGGLPGVHNSYLMVLGEAGIIPFLLIIGIYAYLLVKSFKNFKSRPELFYLTCVLVLALMVGHGYFDSYYNVLLSMYVYVKLKNLMPV